MNFEGSVFKASASTWSYRRSRGRDRRIDEWTDGGQSHHNGFRHEVHVGVTEVGGP